MNGTITIGCSMTEPPTVELNGVEVSSDNLEEAIEQARNGNTIHSTSAVVGDVALVGDAFADGDFQMANVEDLTKVHDDGLDAENIAYTNISNAERYIEEAREESFDAVGYVEGVIDTSNTIVLSETSEAYTGHGDVEAQYGYFEGSEFTAIEDDEALSISHVGSESGVVFLSLAVDEGIASEE